MTGICQHFTMFYNGGQLLLPTFMFKQELAIWYRDALLYTACWRRGREIRGACTALFDTISAGANSESEACIMGAYMGGKLQCIRQAVQGFSGPGPWLNFGGHIL